ncbi:Zn-dependent exopeptidase [Mycena chlorophos]|uniref:Zn-dependent exopeptidase n=1 Tax=Mycena chlorophos TaxID=658473 RepID=A0A8H6VTH2_MYCCL|nr:Zn-dependent exopeptidase [Mycena chlorophos]
MSAFQQQNEGLCLKYAEPLGSHRDVNLDMALNMLGRGHHVASTQPFQWGYIDKPNAGEIFLVHVPNQAAFPIDGIRYQEAETKYTVPAGPTRSKSMKSSLDSCLVKTLRRGGNADAFVLSAVVIRNCGSFTIARARQALSPPLSKINPSAATLSAKFMSQACLCSATELAKQSGLVVVSVAGPNMPGGFNAQQMLAQQNNNMAMMEQRRREQAARQARQPRPEEDDSGDENESSISTRALSMTRYRRNHEFMSAVFAQAAFGDKNSAPKPTPYSIFNKAELEAQSEKLRTELAALEAKAAERRTARETRNPDSRAATLYDLRYFCLDDVLILTPTTMDKVAEEKLASPLPLVAVPPPPVARRNPFFKRVAIVFALVLSTRIYYVYNHPEHRPAHEHRVHSCGSSARHSGHPNERPQPRLSMEEREELFMSIPDPESARHASRLFTARPHVAGSPQSFRDALQMLDIFQEQFEINSPKELPVYPAGSRASRWATTGLTSSLLGPRDPTAWVDVYYPVLDTGVEQRLEILGDDGEVSWTADLVEDGDPLDSDAHEFRDAVPTWHGASADGDVTGQLIYANYGTKEDYDELVANGANLTGKIVLARYGGAVRGLKIKGAEELGAVGVLMYSDPRNDGFVTVENGFESYPAGPARNPTAIERGSVAYVQLYPGDPSTPGIPAYEDSNRTAGSNGPSIPSLPISWGNAKRLLEEIDSNGPSFRLDGATSRRSVHLVNHVDAKITPIWNTMAAIPGHVRDEVVVIGGHRDAWVLGAVDSVSGHAVLNEIARGFGALLKAGWRPLRTIVFASWDAEEYGLIGSTEYGEDFGDWLREHVVAYVNVDGPVGGSRWGAAGSPSLSHLIAKTAKDVPHPTKPGKAIWDARTDIGPIQVPSEELEKPLPLSRRPAHRIFEPLGSGSDFSVFMEHLGISSSASGFGAAPGDAVYHYHSIYDTQRWQEMYGDPGFLRTAAVAQHIGLVLLRLTDSIIVPINTTHYSLELNDYLDEIEDIVTGTPLAYDMADDIEALRQAIATLTAVSIELDAEKEAAEKDFLKLLNQLPEFPRTFRRQHSASFKRRFIRFVKRVLGVAPHSWRRAGLHVPDAWEEYLDAQFFTGAKEGPRLPRVPPLFKFIKAARRVTKANKKLEAFERGFIDQDGIQGREWYKNKIVAPGRWKGYGATTMPGLNEALALDGDVAAASLEAVQLLLLIEQLTADLSA